jgi:hippurate hydrolase
LIKAGTKRNITPETALLEATVRTFDPAVSEVIAETAERVRHGITLAHGVEVDVAFLAEYPVTINDAAEASFALGVAGELLGTGATLIMPNPIIRSKDFPDSCRSSRGHAVPRLHGRRK